VTAVHDLSDGGLAVGVAEMAMSGGIGATIAALPFGLPSHAELFGEDQARYVVTVKNKAALDELSRRVGAIVATGEALVLMTVIGKTGGDALTLPGEMPISLSELHNAHENWLPSYMAGEL